MGFLSKYSCSFRVGLQDSMEYRTDFFLSLLSVIMPVVMQVYMWTAIYSATGQGMLYGYTFEQMIVYSLFAGLVSKFVSSGFEGEMAKDVKEGGLNKYIVKPIGYFFHRFFAFIGRKFFPVLVLSLIMIVVGLVIGPVLGFRVPVMAGILFIVSLGLSLLLNFLIFYCVGLLAFWITEVSLLFGTIRISLVVISGGIFPLDIFGSAFTAVVNFLPFKYTTQFTVDILNGRLADQALLWGFAMQVFWILAFYLLSRIGYREGLKKYISAGG